MVFSKHAVVEVAVQGCGLVVAVVAKITLSEAWLGNSFAVPQFKQLL